MKYGKLTVLSIEGKKSHCLCDCGKEKTVFTNNIKRGLTKSCGCERLKNTIERNKTHGKSNHKFFRIWASIISRCSNKNEKAYKNYGGRGIDICDQWKSSFKNFYDWCLLWWDEGLEIDRIDNNKGYSPDNCRFVTPKENSMNRRSNLLIEFNGLKKPLKYWTDLYGLKYKSVHKGIRYKNKQLSDYIC